MLKIDTMKDFTNRLKPGSLWGIGTLSLLFLMLWSGMVNGQVATGYVFSESVGTYTPITGGAVLANCSPCSSDQFDEQIYTITLPTAVNFNNTAVTTVGMAVNGYLIMGGVTTLGLVPISSSTTGVSCIAGLAVDLTSSDNPGMNFEMRWQDTGTEYVFQWSDVSRYLVVDELSFQIRINKTSGIVRIIYDEPVVVANSTARIPQVGLRGVNNTDYNARRLTTTVPDASPSWVGPNGTAAASSNAHNVRFTSGAPAAVPVGGLTFTWSPPTDAVDYGNLQFPGTGSIAEGGTLTAFGQAYEPGVTEIAGQGAGLTAWIGYNTTNTDPSTWTTWVAAPFNIQVGNNDEFMGMISPPGTGTYYYAFRYQLNGGPFRYGGYSISGGGFWNGTTNVNGVLTVNCSGLVNSFPYTEGFESSAGGWITQSITGTEGWVRGTPNKTGITTANGGTNAMVTSSLTANYGNSQTFALKSPCFDLSSFTCAPVLSFWMNMITESGWDAMDVEYSTDGGGTWTKLGTTSATWYNSTSTNGSISQPKFSSATSGVGNGWQQQSIQLPVALVGQPNARLRLRFGSDTSTGYAGFAIDDIELKATIADASVSNLTLPATACSLTASETVTVRVNNVTCPSIATGAASVTLSWTGAGTGSATLANTGAIAAGGNEVLTFTGINLSADGTYNFTATVTYAGDPVASNNNVVGSTTNYAVPAVTAAATMTNICAGESTDLSASVTPAPAPVTVTIGTGTTSEGTATPYRRLWGAQKLQLLYTVAELSAAGLTNGSAISQLAFNVNGGTPSNLGPNFSISAKLTSTANLAAAFETGLTTVYGPTAGGTPVTGWNTYTLTTPITWDGTSNLVIETCFYNNDAGLSTANVAATSLTNLARYANADNQTSCPAGGGTASSSRANIQFTFIPTLSYNWTSDPAGFMSSVEDPGTVSPAVTTTYYVAITDANSCTSQSSVTVNVAPSTTWYQDSDMDTYGNPAVTLMACVKPMGYVANSDDCDDTNGALNPTTVWYLDADNDNYSTGAGITQCVSPGIDYKYTGLLGGNDCNDANMSVNPGATEVCDGIDNNCNMMTDEGVQTTYYADSDGDGFGNPAVTQMACSAPMGYVANSDDCDDTNGALNPNTIWYLDADNDNYSTGAGITQCTSPGIDYKYTGLFGNNDCNDANMAVNPGATEVCDGIDNNCNMMTDEGVQTTFYADADGDGFGNLAVSQMACSAPMGYVANSNDCDDTNGAINPNTFWYLDADNDSYFTGAGIMQCVSPGVDYKYTGLFGSNDCNDGNAAINPAATEVCDGVDNNCNMMTDEGVQTTYYADSDGDGFGNPAVTQMACSAPMGYVANSNDCDDTNGAINPNTIWYLDADNDNYYVTGSGTTQCVSPGAGYKYSGLLGDNDCNDGDPAINPGATEIVNGIDDNCNDMIDETGITYYRDMDGDGFGDPLNTILAGSPPMGYVLDNTDCNDNSALEKPGQVWYKDTDGDGYAETGAATITQCLRPMGYKAASELTSTTGDCNDNAAAINPAATEVCDGVDNNCNSMTDEGVQTTYYADADGDGFGNPAVTQMACSQPMGYVANNTDCNDNSALEKPGQVWYKDTDGDGYAETGAMTITQCLRPVGYKAASELTSTTGDCNDNAAAINPAATEVCDGVDNNCNMMTDEGVQATYYADADGDGFGNPAVMQMACTQPMGYVANNTDCNDNSAVEKPGQVWYKDTDGDNYAETGAATITQCLRPVGYKAASELTSTTGDCNDNAAALNPAATELCDGIDNNCNSMTDEGVQATYYADADGDGFGNPAVTQMACAQPMGYVANNMDCNDNSALEKPGQVWYKDTDGDGYAQTGAATITQCLRPMGYKVVNELISTTGDCNDNAAAINPAATEVCDGVDNNCNSMTDEGVQTTYYRDMDGDGFGNPAVTQMACTQPMGYVANNTDCNDNSALEKPGQVWYKDTDGDGYAQTGAATITQCLRPMGYKAAIELTSTTGDCNDNAAAINPAATELCDGVDNNCNMMTDEGVQATYYADADSDGFGNPAVTQMACAQPMGYVANNTDCNDNSALEKPGQVWYKDTDNDGYAQTGAATITQCLRPMGYKVVNELISTTGDCNDNAAAINPAATELCDGVDNNCNMMTDEGVQTTYYADADGDGFGNPAVTQMACTQPMGYVANNTDCNDNSALEKPGQVWYKDTDGDGYAQTGAATITQCLRPMGYKVVNELISTTGDCNDNNAAINPAAAEVCDGLDNNCNNQTDESQTIGGAWSNGDVGGSDVNGSAAIGCTGGSNVYNVSANGFSTSSSDKLHLVYQTMCGNGEIIARVLDVASGGWAGVTLRESLMPGSRKVALKTQLTSMIRREIRTATNGPASILNFNRPAHVWLRLVRNGGNFVGYTSPDGQNWDFAFSANVPMTGCIYAGIFAESINTNVTTTASFDNVSIGGAPALGSTAQNFRPSLDGLTVSVYPNPSNGDMTLSVQTATDRNLNLKVMDAFGRIVRDIELQEGSAFTYPLDLSKEPAGVYYLRLRSEDGVENVQRIVLQR